MKRISTQFLSFLTLLLSLHFSQKTLAQATVVIPGSFQSELGCTGDWMPDCNATRLISTGPSTWEGTFYIPAGSWEYKVTYDNSWAVNFGLGGVPGGANYSLFLGSPAFIHFTYSSISHLVNISFVTSTVVLAGSFQNELGCSGDWMPDCAASGLSYDPVANLWTGIFAIPPGNWEYKVTINNSWAENYGLGGVPGGANIPLTVTGDKKILFRYNPVTHLVTTSLVQNVTLAGSFNSELGCSGDWVPDCGITALNLDGGTNTYKTELILPAGNYEFKVTLDGSWAENYGEGGVLNGPNIPLNLSETSKVSFVYNPDTHIIKYTVETITVVLPGSFQTELGCAGDWDPACDNSRLTYDATSKLWTGSFDIPAGNWEFKVALNNSWTENYGMNGVPNGTNISLNLEAPANITFKYDPVSHLVTLVYNKMALCATAFYDVNANGIRDYTENIPMKDVLFTLSGKSSAAQYSDSSGKACFGNLTKGDYTIEATVPTGYLSSGLDSQSVYLMEPKTLNFGIVCLGGAGARKISFWMNKQGKAVYDSLEDWRKTNIFIVLRYLNLRNADGSDFDPLNYEELRTWLQRANSKNMAYKLSAQMAVLYLNAEIGNLGNRMIYTPGISFLGMKYGFMSPPVFILYINQQLFSNSMGGDPNRAQHEYLRSLVEQANSDLSFVQLQPCGLPVSAKARPVEEIIDMAQSAATQIWPNPSGTRFNLRTTFSTNDGNIRIRVLDRLGKPVYSITGSANKVYQFGEGFTPGLYFVEIVQGSKHSTIKIVKQ